MKGGFLGIANLPDSKILVVFFIISKAAEDIQPKDSLASEL
jgi:hypothetical protein